MSLQNTGGRSLPYRRASRKADPKKVLGYVYLIPALLIAAGMILYPLLYGIYTSFFQWNWMIGIDKIRFIGLDNYLRMMKDVYFWNALKNTLIFSVLSLGIEFAIGLSCALLLNEKIRGSLSFRTVMMFPLMLSDIVAALMWRMMLEPSSGVINQMLTLLHLGAPDWLGEKSLVILTLALVDAWWQTGNIIIILLAGLQSLPVEPLEMTRVDGANRFQTFIYVIWPQLIPYAKTALIFRLIDLLRVFALSWAITGGGPVRASEVSQLYIYTQGMGKYLDIGYSISLSLTFALIVGLLVTLVNRGLKERA